jgi:CheY-like chemotaxis protein
MRKQYGTALMRPAHPEAINVLLVSRHTQTIETVCQCADQVKIHVDTCDGRDAAVRILCHAKYEGVLVDLLVEDEGTQLLRTLRQLAAHQSIVAFAILGPSGEKIEAFQAGANFVFERPLSPAVVLRVLKVSYPMLVRERRHYFRCPWRARVLVTGEGKDEFVATTIDVSETGMAILSPVPLQVGEQVRLRFHLAGAMEFGIGGDVCWVNASGRAGIRFARIGKRVAECLQMWIKNQLQGLVPNT